MDEGIGGGTHKPDPDQDLDQIWGSVFNDPTAPFWDEATTPAPTPRADDASPAPAQEPPPAPPERPVPPTPPGVEYRATGAAYRNRGAEHPSRDTDHRPTGAAYRNRGAEHPSRDAEHRPTGAAYRNGRQPAAGQGSMPAGPPVSNPCAQQSAVQYGQPQRKSRASSNTWTIFAILSLFGPPSISALVFAFSEFRRGSRDPGSSHSLNTIAWIVFTAACLIGTVGFLVHAIFPF
jgi:hypothetical protein